MSRLKLLFGLLLACLMSLSACAHPMNEWFTDMRWATGQGLSGQFRVPKDQRAQLDAQPILFSVEGKPLVVTWEDDGFDSDDRALVKISAIYEQDVQDLTITLPKGLLDENQSLVGFLRFDGQEPNTVLISAGDSKTLHPPETGTESPSLFAFFRFGLKHILEGLDHLLFLFCLLIAGGTFRHLAVVVTSFTLGHSITLALSVLGYVSLPSQLTESAIALSIVAAALWNLRRPKDGVDLDEEVDRSVLSRGVMAVGFGLIHGLGFANMLLQNGLSGTGVVVPLLGFNLGVEAGQIALVVMFFPVLRAIHNSKHRRTIITVSSLLAAGMGFFWFLERIGVITWN